MKFPKGNVNTLPIFLIKNMLSPIWQNIIMELLLKSIRSMPTLPPLQNYMINGANTENP